MCTLQESQCLHFLQHKNLKDAIKQSSRFCHHLHLPETMSTVSKAAITKLTLEQPKCAVKKIVSFEAIKNQAHFKSATRTDRPVSKTRVYRNIEI
jgi:hypothetical protein